MTPAGCRAVLFPIQLDRLAELFPEGGAVAIFQDGSTITAYNGKMSVTLNARGDVLAADFNQETSPKC